jgi:hypothetical protein
MMNTNTFREIEHFKQIIEAKDKTVTNLMKYKTLIEEELKVIKQIVNISEDK